LTFGGSVGGAGGGITKIGDGILALNGANTYDGATDVQGGMLRLNNAAALGSGNLKVSGGVVGLGAADFTLGIGTGAGQVQWAGNAGFAAFGANRALNFGGAGALLTWQTANFGTTGTSGNAIIILSHATSDATIDFQNALSLGTGTVTRTVQVENGSAAVDARISGVISSATGTQTLLKTGRGTLELTAANTYAGATQVVGGTLLISSTGSLAGSSVVTVAGGAHFRYDGTAAFNNSMTLLAGAKFSYNSATDYTGSVLGLNAKLGGTNWNGSLSGQMIGLNQIYSTITPGNSPGNATTGSQTWAAGGAYDFEINDGASALVDNSKHDHLTITGSFGLDSSLTGGDFIVKLISLDAGNNAGLLANFDQFANHVWELASFGSVSGQAFDANYFTVDTSGFQNAASGIWSVAMNGTNNGLNLVYTATTVPEPSTYALFAIGLSFMIWQRRRQAIRVVARV
jgi:autotransporter-associated beta strand protein